MSSIRRTLLVWLLAGLALIALVLRLRDLQRVRALHERVHAPVAVVPVHGRIAGRRRHRQPGPRLRPVDEHAVAIPDLRDELGDAVARSGGAGIEARLASAQQVVDPGRIRELLQLQIEQLTHLVARRDVGRTAREHPNRDEPRE